MKRNARGQAMVEFTLSFLLLLIVIYIPVDFGLMLYTAHIAQNAAREGARIAAADRAPVTDSCALAACYALDNKDPKYRAAVRVNRALLPNANVQLILGGTGCNQTVTMRITGTYNFFFYRMLRWLNADVGSGNPNIVRAATMRWEHQC